jgi:hypothetical protein
METVIREIAAMILLLRLCPDASEIDLFLRSNCLVPQAGTMSSSIL